MNLGKIIQTDGICVTHVYLYMDGCSDVTSFNIKGDIIFPDKAMQITSMVYKVVEKHSNETFFLCIKPNSPKVTTPLLNALADEDSITAMSHLLYVYERDALQLRDSRFTIYGKENTLVSEFETKLIADKKLLHNILGCSKPSSKFLCHKGFATKESCKQEPQSCKNEKSQASLHFWAEWVELNRNNETPQQLYMKGHGQGIIHPVTMFEPSECPDDVLHQGDINQLSLIIHLAVLLKIFQEDSDMKKHGKFEEKTKQ